MPFDFEPEVELPLHPFQAAIVFLAVMAYPERGAGQPGAAGSEFAGSLVNYMRWAARKQKGLVQLRREFGDPNFQPPQWAQFKGKMNRGLKRIQRRAACYSLHGTRVISAFFEVRAMSAKAVAEGRREEEYEKGQSGDFGVPRSEIWQRAFRSPRQIVSKDVDRWAERLGLNFTGSAADPNQKAKDLHRRAISQSLPVLHMAHALDTACREVGPSIGGWGKRDPALALLMNAEKWIDDAVNIAELWRLASSAPMIPDVTPDTMIKLERSKS
jgi:hypothetical protein